VRTGIGGIRLRTQICAVEFPRPTIPHCARWALPPPHWHQPFHTASQARSTRTLFALAMKRICSAWQGKQYASAMWSSERMIPEREENKPQRCATTHGERGWTEVGVEIYLCLTQPSYILYIPLGNNSVADSLDERPDQITEGCWKEYNGCGLT
jgi:hypothetical protein